MNVPCSVHADRRAHHGCHFCRKPICRLCEVKMRRHLYCSTRCSRDAARTELWNQVRERLIRPVPTRLAIFSIVLAVCAPTVLALRAVSQLDRLNAPSALAPARRVPVARIESVSDEAGARRIEGSAPPGTAVFLFAGGQFAGATPAQQGRFRFEGVRQPGPYRVGALFLSQELLAPAVAPPASETQRGPSRPRASGAWNGPFIPDLTRGPLDRREILVSFDAGSSDRGAAEILDALKQRGIQTTIFVTGDFIRHYPDLTRRITADGHEVGNHTDTHPHLTTYAQDGRQITRPGVDRAFLTGELLRTARLFRQTTGREIAPLWRAPYGEQNSGIRWWAAQAGYWHVGWTAGRGGLDSLDWISDPRSPAYRSSERVVERLVDRAENGGVALLHLASDRDDPVASRIPQLLDALAHRGFRLARASEFLEREGLTEARLASIASRLDAPIP